MVQLNQLLLVLKVQVLIVISKIQVLISEAQYIFHCFYLSNM